MELLLFVAVLSLDALTAGIAYGTEKIKIGVLSAAIISLVGGGTLLLSTLLGSYVSGFLSEQFCKAIAFLILFLVGLFNFLQGALKTYIKKQREHSANMHFKLRELDFFVEVLVDETKADADHSSSLGVKEALYLALALSVDSLATGLGAGVSGLNAFELGFAAIAANLLAVFAGCMVGKTISRCTKLDLSWLGGAILIGLALFRFLAN